MGDINRHMLYFVIKTFITAIVVVMVAEIAKRSSLLAGLIVSIPLTTFLAFIWLYWETKDTQKIIDLSNATVLMVIPSLSFFIFIPILLKLNLPFILSMSGAVLLTAVCYFIFIFILQKIGLVDF
jgi:glucose-6-phosphate-specific signal transduction histidine kinase|tara:strand:- start:885 stop:1259 length:375 start_codon:yes stop_codon:yes gene_type:complete